MKIFKKLGIIIPVCLILLFFVVRTFAAAPDGAGPWADTVVSSSQGMMKNGLPVPAIRSNPSSALGVAENDTVDGHFFSLGFGGNIVLGFDNGISSGIFVVEATNTSPLYPIEKAKIELSENGTTWMTAGTVNQDGQVSVPDAINCAKFVRITDISDPAIMPDAIADGYDVDGAQAIGESCTQTPTQTPTTIPTNAILPSSTPTSVPNATATPTNTPSSSSSTNSNRSNSPGFPNTGVCTPSVINVVPNIIEARRLSPTSIFVNWGTSTGFTNFVVEYGFQNGNWQFNTHVNGTSTTINDLPANQSIWIHVAATDNCAIGSYGGAVLVGGTPTTNSPGFPNTGTCSSNPLIPCFPNTGNVIPGLPNTGIDPENNIFLNIENGITNILSALFKIIKI